MTYQQPYQPPPAQPPYFQAQPPYGPVPAPPQAPRGKNRTWLWVLGGVLALLVLCVGGGAFTVFAAYHYGDPAGPTPSGTPFARGSRPGLSPAPEPTPLASASTVPAGRTVTVTGEKGDSFTVTVKTRKVRKTPCDPYASKPESGRYVVADITLKALKGQPDVSPFSFKFREPDGNELDVATGSGCNDIGEMAHGIKAGRKGTATVSFDVATPKGEIVLQWPTYDDAASWKVG